jgi:uncharacterized protein Yka (UPF0111/DUF47 family)
LIRSRTTAAHGGIFHTYTEHGMVRLFPKDDSYFDELETLAGHLTSAADLLNRLFQDPREPARLERRIRTEEHEADELTHEITSRLDGSLVAPFDREDLYAIARGLDNVVDLVEDASAYVAAFEILRADEGARELAGVLLRSSLLVATAVAGLRTSGLDRKPFREIQALGEEGDAVYERVMTKLF